MVKGEGGVECCGREVRERGRGGGGVESSRGEERGKGRGGFLILKGQVLGRGAGADSRREWSFGASLGGGAQSAYGGTDLRHKEVCKGAQRRILQKVHGWTQKAGWAWAGHLDP